MPITTDKIQSLNKKLERRFRDKLVINNDLKRTLVRFQANKKTPGYRWYKFKEGYSSALVAYAIDQLGIKSGKVIDPFAGSGTVGVVSIKNNRKYILIEKEKENIDLIHESLKIS